MPTNRDYKDFKDQLLSDDILDDVIVWIQNNLDPNEIFLEETLRVWAFNNGFVREEE